MSDQSLPKNHQSGQVLLIIVLVMIVALTIGLSVVTRSITNLQISSEEESSQRALSAAEAGIEKALQSDQGEANIDLKNNSEIRKVTVNNVAGQKFLVNNGNLVLKDDGADVWLSTNDSSNAYPNGYNGYIKIYWGSKDDVCTNDSATNTAAALEIVVITKKDGGSTQVRTYPVDPCNTTSDEAYNRVAVNNFCTFGSSSTQSVCSVVENVPSGSEIGGRQFAYSTSIYVENGVMARVLPLYAPTNLGIEGLNGDLVSQGSVIESLGVSGSTQRKISVYKGFAKVPVEFFPYVLFSP